MQKAADDQFIFLRLDHDEEIIKSIAEATVEEVTTLAIISALGMMHDLEIGYFDRGTYIKKKISEPVELLSMCGSISSQGENRIHIHVSIADRKHNSMGGHLLSGRVWMSEEIMLVRLRNLKSERSMDPEKKVGILRILKD